MIERDFAGSEGLIVKNAADYLDLPYFAAQYHSTILNESALKNVKMDGAFPLKKMFGIEIECTKLFSEFSC